jgi:CRP-like cAMP-binding protein
MIYTSSVNFKPPNEARESRIQEKMSEEDKKYICEQMTLKCMKAGQVVFNQGEPGKDFFIILKG